MSISKRSVSEQSAAKLAAKAEAAMRRVENAVLDAPREGYAKNGYGDYYKLSALEAVLVQLSQAQAIDELEGHVRYLRGGFLAWANRLGEAAVEYEWVLANAPRLKIASLCMLAGVRGRMGQHNEALQLVQLHNEALALEGLPLPPLSLHQLNIADFTPP